MRNRAGATDSTMPTSTWLGTYWPQPHKVSGSAVVHVAIGVPTYRPPSIWTPLQSVTCHVCTVSPPNLIVADNDRRKAVPDRRTVAGRSSYAC